MKTNNTHNNDVMPLKKSNITETLGDYTVNNLSEMISFLDTLRD